MESSNKLFSFILPVVAMLHRVLVLMFLLYWGSVRAEVHIDFSEPALLVSGEALKTGAIYRFPGVSDQRDALLEITAVVSAKLVSIDNNDRDYPAALQPEVEGNGLDSYVEFRLTIVDSAMQAPQKINAVVSALSLGSPGQYYTLFDASDFTVEGATEISYEIREEQILHVTRLGQGHLPVFGIDTLTGVSISLKSLDSFIFRIGAYNGLAHRGSLLFEPIEFVDGVLVNINDDPLARDDTARTIRNTSLIVDAQSGVLGNDTDIDIAIDTDKLGVASIINDGVVYKYGVQANLPEGSLLVQRDGSYVFTPAANYTGPIPKLEYILEDGNGGTDTGALHLSVGDVATAPELNDDVATLSSRIPVVVDVLANDTVSDGVLDISSLKIVADVSAYPDGTTLSIDRKTFSVTDQGVWDVTVENTIRFTPDVETTGVVTPIDYQVDDGNENTAFATVTLLDGLASDAPQVTISEDRDNNGFISQSELVGLVDVSVNLPPQARTNDTVSISNGDSQLNKQISEAELLVGIVSGSFTVPADGVEIRITAIVIDEAGNESASAHDSATLDITPTDTPEVFITADSDNSGFISSREHTEQVMVEVRLPASARVGDKVTINSGTTTTDIVLGPLDIAEGSVNTVVPVSAEGETLTILVQVIDGAGNSSAVASDSAVIDTIAPDPPFVSLIRSASATPMISGGRPLNENYLLTVEVNGVIYGSGDGNLSERDDGTWRLHIPLLNELQHGVYDVIATVKDMAGNSTSDLTTNELVIDLVLPTIDVSAVRPSPDPAPVLAGATDQPDGAIVTVETDEGLFVCMAPVGSARWSCRPQTVLQAGNNALVASIQDIAGNTAATAFTVSVMTETDADGDGIPDMLEGTGDSDRDGVSDHLDLDSDNDSILDAIETAGDRDGDGVRNYLDTDSDNDGLADLLEAQISALADANQDGMIDDIVVGDNGVVDQLDTVLESHLNSMPVDTDGDSVADYLDHDSDNDGFYDFVENASPEAGFMVMQSASQLAPALDFDRDRVANYIDLDSDNDGITDLLESLNTDADGNGLVDSFIDANMDGVSDGLSVTSFDLDGDGALNSQDLDSDGDGIADLLETGGVDADSNGLHDIYLDANGNGIADAVDSAITFGDDRDNDGVDDRFDTNFIETEDRDRDGIADEFDLDANGDGIADMLADVVLNLPDADSNGLPDAYEPKTTSATIQTGRGPFGGGCALRSAEKFDAKNMDVQLLLLLIAALAGIHRHRLSNCRF